MLCGNLLFVAGKRLVDQLFVGLGRDQADYGNYHQSCEHREQSYFKKIDGEWRFIDGEIEKNKPFHREEPKIGRNDPCPCGSGKKYKKCCGKGK